MEKLVLNGKELAKRMEEELKQKVEKIKEKTHKNATLATIIVGDDPSSKTYVKMKSNACARIGINSLNVELKEDTTTEELLNVIKELNENENVDGILLQHPVPRSIDERECFDAIDPIKDVDGVTSINFGKMAMNKETHVSATPFGIMKILEHYNIEIEGKEAVVIGRSPILGKPVAMMLLNKNATVTITHSKTKNLEEVVKRADIVVACVGKPKFVKKEWLKENVVIIDAGYNEGNIGDVDLENAIEKASAYTPVPGGVGPMTIVSLLVQTVNAYEKRVIDKNN